jgi:TPR repeat protein
MKWYKLAAAGGLTEAYYFVGSGYSLGAGVRQSVKQALGWFRRAAESGDLDGAYMEAVTVIDMSPSARKGMQLMLRAARRGSRDAMDYLAQHYLNAGRLTEAKSWAKKAIASGDKLAPLRLREIVARERISARR